MGSVVSPSRVFHEPGHARRRPRRSRTPVQGALGAMFHVKRARGEDEQDPREAGEPPGLAWGNPTAPAREKPTGPASRGYSPAPAGVAGALCPVTHPCPRSTYRGPATGVDVPWPAPGPAPDPPQVEAAHRRSVGAKDLALRAQRPGPTGRHEHGVPAAPVMAMAYPTAGGWGVPTAARDYRMRATSAAVRWASTGARHHRLIPDGWVRRGCPSDARHHPAHRRARGSGRARAPRWAGIGLLAPTQSMFHVKHAVGAVGSEIELTRGQTQPTDQGEIDRGGRCGSTSPATSCGTSPGVRPVIPRR